MKLGHLEQSGGFYDISHVSEEGCLFLQNESGLDIVISLDIILITPRTHKL